MNRERRLPEAATAAASSFSMIGQLVPLEELAWYRGLALDARAVLEAFREDFDAGRLVSAQFRSLRALEAALAKVPAPAVLHFRQASCPPSGPPCPAADLTPGDTRFTFATRGSAR